MLRRGLGVEDEDDDQILRVFRFKGEGAGQPDSGAFLLGVGFTGSLRDLTSIGICQQALKEITSGNAGTTAQKFKTGHGCSVLVYIYTREFQTVKLT